MKDATKSGHLGQSYRKANSEISTSTVVVDDDNAKSVDNWFDDLEHCF